MRSDPARRFWLYFVLAGAALTVALLAYPIVPNDTDLWYHLNFGRRIVATLSIPVGAWYSYVDTEPGFIEYFWLSQVVYYGLHHAFGALGLIALRAALFAALFGTLSWLAARSELARASRGCAAFAALLVLLVVFDRFNTVRPHLFSYVLLAAAIALVERGGRALYALIPVAALWANLHGIEYPVLWLVLGGAGAEQLVRFRAQRRLPRAVLILCAAGLAVLLTPFGARLLPVPFNSLGLVGREIFELRALPWSEFTTFGVTRLVPSAGALRMLVALFAAMSFITAAARGTLRLRHAVWLLGASYLLTRAYRFEVEFALLALPSILATPLLAELSAPVQSRWARVTLAALLATLSLARFVELTRGPWPYPVANGFLPRGTVALLLAHGEGGRVLHHPNYGGYLQWALGERFTIGADMQTPFFFSGRSVLELSSAYAEPRALRTAAAAFHADYVLVPWSNVVQLESGIADAYAPIGFDDVVIAYAHRQRRASVVSRLELHALAPANFDKLLRGELAAAQRGPAGVELGRLAAVDDHVAIVRAAQAVLADLQGDRGAARRYAEAAAALAPGHADVLRIAGEIALEAGALPEALDHFTRGLELAHTTFAPRHTRTRLCWGAARTMSKLGRSSEVYPLLLAAYDDLTSPAVSFDDLRLLAAAARDAGEQEAAGTFVHLAELRGGVLGQPGAN